MNPVIEFFFGPPLIDPFGVAVMALDDGVIVKQTDTKIVVADEAGNKIVFTGDLTPGGEVTGLKIKNNGVKVAQGEDLKIATDDLTAALGGIDPEKSIPALILVDNLLVKGSPFGEYIRGVDGDGIVVKGRHGDDFLFGGEGNQTLKGGKGNDIIGGRGEKDKLYGGEDNDIFFFDLRNLPAAAEMEDELSFSVHRIKDFSHEDDSIYLSGENFDQLAGPLDKDFFVKGTEAVTEDHRIIYDKATGSLYFDDDGSGELMDPVKFGKVDPGTKVTASDFFVDFDVQ